VQIAVGQSLSDSMQVTTVCACRCHHAEYLTAPDHCDTSNHPDQLSNRTMHVQLTATAAPLPPAAHAWPPAFGDTLNRSAHTRFCVGSMQGMGPMQDPQRQQTTGPPARSCMQAEVPLSQCTPVPGAGVLRPRCLWQCCTAASPGGLPEVP
jgi:hypothetical protein